MRIYLFLMIVGFAYTSCSVQRKHTEIDEVNNVNKGECHELLDSLTSICRPLRYGLLQIDYSGFSTEAFEGLTIVERASRGIPKSEKEQRMYLFAKLLERIDDNDECKGCISKSDIQDKLGEPSNRSSRDKVYRYFLNSGLECPNCNLSVSRVFDNCDYIRFYFEGNRLVEVDYDLYMKNL